ncbi:hypothetical protein [Saccharicrinis fermentans]|uniref:Uncharacterized protein n=1 Tax=Saccharicrinis fermentans DSM 9555 = JCM 21142 TaxID=869213 RepID=W7YSF5_9BACT|nr:hypothetical protein [Saccharicrinis fermentans]GAF05404.1 hypothetical protein JCM21142_104138 [Saccharicrinis fermentans DSM 9555 = JCM 21142]
MKICKEYKICTDRGLAIVFDRTVNQGAAGCRSLINRIFKTKENKTVDEELDLLYKVRDNWKKSNFIYKRIDDILKTSDFNNQQYIL